MATSKQKQREIIQARLAEIKAKKLESMRQLNTYIRDNRIEFFVYDKMSWGPNPKQALLLNAWDNAEKKVFTFTGGNRTGKTTLGVILAFSTMFGFYPWDKDKTISFPHSKPRKVRIVGQDWEKHIKAVVVPELEKWWPKNRKLKKKKNNVGIDAHWSDIKTGSTLEIMSNNQDSDLHEGWQGDLIYYDEPPKRDIRVANARGLVDRTGRELFCMTLLKEAWVDREVIKAVDENGKPDNTVHSIHAEIYDNVGFGITEEGVKQFAKTLTDDEKEARLKGIPSYMSGLVAKNFKRDKHLKERFQIPLDWPVDIAIDVHPRKEQAILFSATSPRNEKYLFREVWSHGDGTWIGEEIIRIVNRSSLRVNRVIIDPLAKSDSNNDNTTYDKIDTVLGRHGYFLETASKEKDSGIIEINSHLKGPNNEPSLFIFDDMVRTLFEIEGWMYDKETQKAKKECVVGETLIDTPTGQHRIKDLVGKNMWVYSYSHNKKRVNVRKAYDIRKTEERAEIWKLTMDRGVLLATPDHPILLRDGTYRDLKDLKPCDSLMPLYRNVNNDGYTVLKTNAPKGQMQNESEHRIVYRSVNGSIPEGLDIHHIDGNYLNHAPGNLEAIDPAEHQRRHTIAGVGTAECKWCGKAFSQKRRWQKHCSKKCRQSYGDSRRNRIGAQVKTCAYCGVKFKTNNGPKKYCSITCRGYSHRDRRRKPQGVTPNNHRVVSVDFFGYEDVYNMEVEDDHNFCANGVFVHNCDDMMENLYRLLLLGTQYTPPEDDYADDYQDNDVRDGTTGY
ncbi:MAG: hypothetical protein GY845_30430 [Planctomycetes bacterium]|nr:hypothetical protein [Planctomycetota bacterium]